MIEPDIARVLLIVSSDLENVLQDIDPDSKLYEKVRKFVDYLDSKEVLWVEPAHED
jgi:hypothetical protein